MSSEILWKKKSIQEPLKEALKYGYEHMLVFRLDCESGVWKLYED